ncbi:hypothetical protein BGZ93_005149 [Podila epicladia]|nr:hypothetical protein BGZ93_005149 [Podila epicladia]
MAQTSYDRIGSPWMRLQDIKKAMHISARESLLFLMYSEMARVCEYRVPTKMMRIVCPITTGTDEVEHFRDVYVLDLETSVWMLLAEGPFAHTYFVAAVAGDQLVLYGSHTGTHVRQMCGCDYGAEMSVLYLENAWVV